MKISHPYPLWVTTLCHNFALTSVLALICYAWGPPALLLLIPTEARQVTEGAVAQSPSSLLPLLRHINLSRGFLPLNGAAGPPPRQNPAAVARDVYGLTTASSAPSRCILGAGAGARPQCLLGGGGGAVALPRPRCACAGRGRGRGRPSPAAQWGGAAEGGGGARRRGVWIRTRVAPPRGGGASAVGGGAALPPSAGVRDAGRGGGRGRVGGRGGRRRPLPLAAGRGGGHPAALRGAVQQPQHGRARPLRGLAQLPEHEAQLHLGGEGRRGAGGRAEAARAGKRPRRSDRPRRGDRPWADSPAGGRGLSGGEGEGEGDGPWGATASPSHRPARRRRPGVSWQPAEGTFHARGAASARRPSTRSGVGRASAAGGAAEGRAATAAVATSPPTTGEPGGARPAVLTEGGRAAVLSSSKIGGKNDIPVSRRWKSVKSKSHRTLVVFLLSDKRNAVTSGDV